jgi:hypothetical protein
MKVNPELQSRLGLVDQRLIVSGKFFVDCGNVLAPGF